MRDVIAQRVNVWSLDVVNLIERDRSMTEQVEQGVALFGKAEAAGQQLYGSDVRAADGRHNFLHENFMLGEALYVDRRKPLSGLRIRQCV